MSGNGAPSVITPGHLLGRVEALEETLALMRDSVALIEDSIADIKRQIGGNPIPQGEPDHTPHVDSLDKVAANPGFALPRRRRADPP